MAATSKEAKANLMSISFKKRLDILECPYTSDVEESWMPQLLIKPGESRIQILHWLFSKFDEAVNEILDVQYATVQSQLDSRLQRLLQVASTLGLCSYDDIDLIKGVITGTKQWAFLDQLLDMVIIAENAEDPHTKVLNSPGVVRDSSSLQYQHTQDCAYVDKLVCQQRMDTFFHPTITLLPPDIAHRVERNWVERGFTKEKPPLPDFTKLSEGYSELLDQLSQQKEILQELKDQFSDKEDHSLDVTTTSKTLALVLKELTQFITGFTYSFENEIRPWCNKPHLHLKPLGPAIKRVHNLLTGLKEFQNGLRSIQLSHDVFKSKSVKLSRVQVECSSAAAEKYEEYISMLEESTSRRNASVS